MKIKPLNDECLIEDVVRLKKDKKAYLVGGCVRDWFLGEKCYDIDITFSKYPLDIAKKISVKYGFDITEFKKFLTIKLKGTDKIIDFATLRKETYSEPAKLPDVTPASSIDDDLIRRDFTTNAIAIDLNKNLYSVIDPFNGIDDIRNGVIRVLHDRSFIDDPTRIFRAARFASRFGWKIEKHTLALIKKHQRYVKFLSKDRIRNEMIKILSEEKCFNALSMLNDFDEIKKILNFKFDKKIDELKTLKERLIYISAFNRTTEFIDNFNFPRDIKTEVRCSVIPIIERMSPQKPIDENAKKVIRMIYPEIGDKALKPIDFLKISKRVKKENLSAAIIRERKKPFLREKI
jgi:tRNA nucleotidyltransferase/poly(A) polymerase